MEEATQVPDDFKCPISLEVMSDPVILSSGHTFDRPSIQRWLDSGNRTCPISKLPLPPHPTLIPNHALRSLISIFYSSSSPKTQPSPSPHFLLSTLTSPFSSPPAQLDSLRTLHRLSRSTPAISRQIADSGAVSTILRLVGSPDPAFQVSALLLLFDLSLDDDNKVGLVAEGAVSRIVSVLRTGAHPSRTLAATTLTSLAVVDVNKGTIGDHPFAIDALVDLLREGEGRGKREAATAMYTLCSFPGNQKKVVKAGAIPVLVELAGSGLERAVEVLALLAKCRQGRERMEKLEGFAETMVGILRRGSPRSTVHALATLASVCGESQRTSSEVMREGVLEICQGMAEGDESEKIRRNATRLIQLLRRCESQSLMLSAVGRQ